MDVFSLVMRLKEEGAAQVKASLDKLNKSFQTTALGAEKVDNATTGLTSAMKGLAAAMGAREFAQMSDNYTNISARLSLVTKSTAEAVALQSQLFAIAQETRTPFEEIANLYLRTANSAEALNLSQADVIRLTRTTAQAVALSGSSASEAAAAIQQLGQALGNGALQAQEWNSLAEQTPRLAKAIAESFGVTTAEFRKQVLAQNVSSQMLAQAILQNKKLNEEAVKLPVTISGAFTQLRNEVVRFVGELNKGTGAASAVVGLITWIKDNLPLLVGIITTVGAAWVGYRAILLSIAAAKAAVAAATAIASGSIAKGAAVAVGATAATFIFAETMTRLKKIMADVETQAAGTAAGTDGVKLAFGNLNKEGKTTVELLVEMSKLRPLTMAESRQLAIAEAGLTEQIKSKNLSLAQSVKLQAQLNDVIEARKTAQMSEAENLELLRKMAPKAGAPIQAMMGLQVKPVAIPAAVLRQMEAQAQGAAEQFAKIADTSFIDEITQTGFQISEAINNIFGNAFAAGIEKAITSGSFKEGFKELLRGILSGLGSLLIQLGTALIPVSKLFAKLWLSLKTLNPIAMAAAAVGLIALGGIMKGVAGRVVEGGGGGGGFTAPAMGGTMSSMAMTTPTQFYGPTAAGSASTIERVNPVNVTIIGPNDPAAQRQMQELVRNAQRRGSV